MVSESSSSVSASYSTVGSRARLELIAVLGLAALLYGVQLTKNGFANPYYAAAVKSMLLSWHNFFFVSFDPAGFVSVDKPPLALWVQALSAKLFGFNSFALLIPQVIAGLATVALIYHLVKHVWGHRTGLFAALVLTLTPITVAINRDNNPDPLLALTLVLAAWAVLRAIETGRIRWIIACAALVGLGFNIKMLQALLVLPAFALTYLVGARRSWRLLTLDLTVALVTLVVIGGSWVVAVDLTPADQRPYVGSSSNNTMRDLIIGYNGLGRLSGQEGVMTDLMNNEAWSTAMQKSPMLAMFFRSMTGGQPGIFRLLTPDIAGQMIWLLPLILGGAIVGVRRGAIRFPLGAQATHLTLWTVWLLTHLVVFSFARGLFHAYYLTVVGPAWSVLVAVSTRALWHASRTGSWRRWMFPVAIASTVGWQMYLLWPNNLGLPIPIVNAALYGAIAVIALATLVPLVYVVRGLRHAQLPRRSYVAAVLALLIGPALWSATPLLAPIDGILPQAGPMALMGAGMDGGNGGAASGGGPGGSGMDGDPTKLIAFLKANRGTTTYLVATPGARWASPLILETGEPVMAMGGFTGTDPILTADKLATLVARREVRFVQTMGGAGGAFPFAMVGGSETGTVGEVSAWVESYCTVVDPALWRNEQRQPAEMVMPPGMDAEGFQALFGGQPPKSEISLYDCASER